MEQAARVMAAAFSGDPSIRYLLGGSAEGANDWRYFLTVLKAIYGKCVMLSTDNLVLDLLVLFPPELQAVPALAFFTRGGITLWKYFGCKLYTHSINYENHCRRTKRNFMTETTWYCMCLVVNPQQQSMGIGSKLLRPVLQILDEHHAPLYLETHKKLNTKIYQHFGFDTVDVSVIPGTNRAQYGMLRQQ